MFERAPNGFFVRDLLVFNHLRLGGYVSKGFIFEAPDLTNSPATDLNEFQDRLCLLLASLHEQQRLQVQYFCDSDYRTELLRYQRETEQFSNVWTKRARNERFTRYWQAMSVDPSASLYTLQTTFGVAVLAFWIVFSTIAAPLVIQKVIADGSLAGSQLISGAFSGLFQTAATTAGAAAVAATTGIPAVTAGAAGMAALLSTLSTSAGHGSAGAILIAGSGLPPRSARGRPGDDITGDKAVRELIAKTKDHYY